MKKLTTQVIKKLATLLFVAILGGTLTLGSYLLFISEKKTNELQEIKEGKFSLVKANNGLTNFTPEGSIDFTKSAKETVDAVVHVKNTSTQTVRDPFAEMIYGRGYGSKLQHQVGTGSGVIISEDGYIITNNHVIKNATELEITLNNKKTYRAEIIGTDSKSDIALVKIEANNLPYLVFGNSDHLQVGEWVLAVGNPFNLTSTVTAGIVSAKARDIEGNKAHESFIQTDAAVNPGNSGGALVNTQGQLIGINTAISSITGSYVGYSFAVPSNIAKKIIEDLLEFGNVQRAVLGVRGGELNGTNSEKLNLKIAEGFFVSEVIENSGAMIAGIKANDIITKLDEVKVKNFSDLDGYLRSKQPGNVVLVEIMRNNSLKIIHVTLTKEEEFAKINLGFSLENMTSKELKLNNLKNGVRIVEIENRELLRYGVQKGFIITKVNNAIVKTSDDIKRIISTKLVNEAIRIEMINLQGEKERYIFN
ncbi:MAG: trypsin-like peptidase domain-containing protein [Flavobacteriaceae bacterium]|nr:trypsin-like peptidase domain-containing protein [Flavobacteriaceae bacterium]